MRLVHPKVAAALAGAGLAVALVMGYAPAAHADVIDDLANEFTTAAGAGQIPSLLNQSLKLRAAGFRPTNGEIAAIQESLKYRPNQTPMINALKDTVAGQTHRMKQAQAANKGQGPVTIGINQYDPNSPGGVTVGPGGINIGGGANGPYQIGGQPGTVVGPPVG
ncbi:MAG TPA: hypothetical protein VFB19_14655 [Mycobacterium sp.]|nr:hypothetical protein [Mycobacterium sp.]